MDKFVLERIVDLGAQAPDRHVDHVGIAVEVHVPDQGNDLRAGQGFPWVAHEQAQQGEFLGSQLDAQVTPERAVATRIQLKVCDPQGRVVHHLVATPLQRADAGKQFRKLERLH